MTSLAYVNARLTKISPVGASADYDSGAVPGADRWAGRAGATVREQRLEIPTPTGIDEVIRTRIAVDWGVGHLIQRGDSLTYEFEGQTYTRVAGTITRSPLIDRVSVTLRDG